MAEAGSFEQIVRQQATVLTAALAAEAESAGVELAPGLADRVGRAIAAGAPGEADARALRECFRGRPPLALVAFDTPGVQDYVFRVRRPVDVAGGSHLVAAFTDRERAREAAIRPVQAVLARAGQHEGALVFAGGGRGLAVVAAHRAERFRTGIEEVLKTATAGDLETVTAEVPVWPADLGATPAEAAGSATSRYAGAVSALMGRLGRERSRRERFGETVDAKDPRCTACRRRVGTIPRPQIDERICPGCAARREVGAKRGADEAKTFQDLVGETDPRLAVLYADGANVGAAFQDIDSMARHRALSEAVEGAFDDAVRAIVQRQELKNAEERLLYQMPIRGGDDAILILPARSALEAATELVRKVESAFDLSSNALLRAAFAEAPATLRGHVGRFGVGVGIVVADCRFPVRFLVRYATELLKSAKGLVHERGAGPTFAGARVRSAVDFLVLASGNPLSESIAGLRETHFRRDPRGNRRGLLLTERPFSIEKLEEVLATARALRDVPQTQRIAVRQEVFRGEALSRSLWRYQHARARDGKGWATFRRALGVDLAAVDGLLWRPAEAAPGAGGERWLSTPYLDALEAEGLLPESRRNGAREANR